MSHPGATVPFGRRSPSQRALLLIAASLAVPLAGAPANGQGRLAIGIDANVEGNGPLSLGPIDPCVSVSRGQTFDVDFFIQDVDELLAWEAYIAFDPDVLEVTGRDVEMFLAGNPGSSVLDVSGRVPNRDGLYRAAAADTSDPPTPDSGSGVLLRLTLKAVGPGTSQLDLASRDVNGDTLSDQGPLLRNVDGEILGDDNGDAIFDGPTQNAEVAVDEPCKDQGSTPSPTNSSSGNGGLSPLEIGSIAAGASVVALAGGFLHLPSLPAPEV